MFDIGWSEMLMIIVVMIIVVGPKDLPRALYTLGQWVGKIRMAARQFQDTIEQAAHQTGLDEVQKEVRSLSNFNVGNEIEKSIDPKGEMRDAFDIQPPDFNAPPEEKPAIEKPAAPAKPATETDKPQKNEAP
jgi:sec-independent protein translocase protein TatB